MARSLGNTFVPSQPPAVTARLLSRQSVNELTNLCLLWLTIPSTRPNPSLKLLRSLGFESRDDFIKDWKQWLEHFKTLKTQKKSKVIDKILSEQYHSGLNLLQLAQLDSQLLVSRPTSFQWRVFELKTPENSSPIASIPDPQKFLQSILNTLSSLYQTHIYISRHPHYPLIIIRIQLFDISHDPHLPSSIGTDTNANTIISRKPIFIGLPMNSSRLLITPHSNNLTLEPDTSYNLILQSLTTALSDTMTREVRITPASDVIVRSLDSAFVMAGNSRFEGSLGAWAVYAAGLVDISPFDDAKKHDTFKTPEMISVDERRKRIAMLRFKGGVEKNKVKLYEGGRKRRKVDVSDMNNDEKDSGDDSVGSDDEDYVENEYESLVPVQNIEFKLTSEWKGVRPTVKIKLQGNDVFGGLHELCDKEIADPELIPGWLTGETVVGGKIVDGVFTESRPEPRGGSLI